MDDFKFMAYRLNKVSIDDLWSIHGRKATTDEDIVAILQHASRPEVDITQKTKKALYKWSIRYRMTEYDEDENPLLSHILFAKSTVEHEAEILEEENLIKATTTSNPPPAETMMIIVYWPRHIVLVENRSQMVTGETWLKHFREIINQSAVDAGFNTTISLQTIPPDLEVVKAFQSFDVIIRLKVSIRIPNPDLSRFTEALKEKLERDGISEITEDMKSDAGLSKSEEGLPFTSVALANDGYKNGPVRIEGYKGDEYQVYEESKDTAKGSLAGFKEFIKGISKNIRTKEGGYLVTAIQDELERICPKE
jgi:hypothetical protein